MNQSIHMIDTLCELMPDIEAVKGFTSSLGHPEMEAEATATAALKFENGALGIVYGSTAAYPGQPKRLEVMGTKGTVIYVEDSYTVFDFQDKKPEDKKILQEFGQMDYKSGFSDPKAIVHDLHTVCFTDFISSIEEGVEFKINGEEALKAVRLIEAIYESSKSREIDKI